MEKKLKKFSDILESALDEYVQNDKDEEIIVMLTIISHFKDIFGDV